MAAKKKLAAANAVLHNNTVSQNEKAAVILCNALRVLRTAPQAKKVVATFLHGSVTALLKNLGLHSHRPTAANCLVSRCPSSGVFSPHGSVSCDAPSLNIKVQIGHPWSV